MRAYHLLSAENGLSDLSLRRLRISRIRDLNDPFELLAVRTDGKELRKVLRNWAEEFNRDNGLLCFSKNWHNPVLWSHYASKHRGMCLGFDVADKLLEDIRYTKDRLSIPVAKNKAEVQLDESFVRDLLRTKFEHWGYEEEVRAFVRLGHSTVESGSYFYPFDGAIALKEVILGPMCELPIDRIRELVHSTYDYASVVKARLAFKWFSVVADERSVRVENAYWEEKGRPAPYVFKQPSPEKNVSSNSTAESDARKTDARGSP
jgi:Protein of unknown function (DUF2971)